MSDLPSFKYQGITIHIEFGYKEVISDFKKLGLDLLAIFEDNSVLMNIMTNDRVMLQIWYHFVSPHAESLEKAVENLTPKEMHTFKEAFWQAVVNFTQPQMRPALEAMKREARKRLESPELLLENSSET